MRTSGVKYWISICSKKVVLPINNLANICMNHEYINIMYVILIIHLSIVLLLMNKFLNDWLNSSKLNSYIVWELHTFNKHAD